jgi:hypothetical protein
MSEHEIDPQAGVPHSLHSAIEALVTEFAKFADTGGTDATEAQAAVPSTAVTATRDGLATGNIVATEGSTAFGGGGALDIALKIGGQDFELKLALPDQSKIPLWGFQVTQGANTVILVLVENGQNWRVEVGAPMLPHTFTFGTGESLTINTLGFNLHKGETPTQFTFTS